MEITGWVIIVTGATSGIGYETAKHLAGEGGELALLARTESKLEAVVEEIRNVGGTAHAFPVDLSERTEIAATAERIQTELGQPISS